MEEYGTILPLTGHSLFDECRQPSSTQLFLTLIKILILSQCDKSSRSSESCTRVQPIQSPDQFNSMKTEFDFIVVGGGVAGAVIAARLAENRDASVLLIEAGGEEPQTSFIPALAFTGLNTNFDWNFTTVPQKRAFKSTGGVSAWPRGKMLCGTACLSGLMYTRGHPSIYNKWGEDNPGWSYNDVMKYFKKSERNVQPLDAIEKEYHGFNGPLKVGNFPHIPKVSRSFLDAIKELNYTIGDVNGRNQEVFTIAPIMVDNGTFGNPRKRYLNPVLNQKNVQVILECHVTRVLLEKKGTRAVGVEFLDKWNKLHTFTAKKEIILSAGVVGSPQILLLSGIGPERDLKRLGIETIRDLPVGGNLHYHVGFSLNMYSEKDDSDIMDKDALLEYQRKRTGPFSSTGLTQVTGFVSSKYAKPGVPDIQFFIDLQRVFKCCKRSSLKNLTFRPVYLLTKCRGTLKLRSKNPKDDPLIDPNYLCNDEEVEALLDARKVVVKLTKTKALKSKMKGYNYQPHRRCKALRKEGKANRAYWKCVITEYTNGENHHAGTCKMGPVRDKTAVVDHTLRVHGIENLRVVDASVMPTPINCNTIAPTVMIAEKAADMIKATWKS